MDDSMTEGTLDKSPQEMDMPNLIRIVRSLDQNGPGANGENLDLLWRSLTASAKDQFHAAEESSLRWILKSMNGSTPQAETIRRYPLSWTILACVFQRIPLFSLAKSLADRRFISILQQALNEICKPETEPASTGGKSKRKRNALAYSLEDLKSTQSCIASGQAIFHALKCLLDRVETTNATASHDKVGAEHIKSLFNTPAADAVATTKSLLTICRLFMSADDSEDVEGWEHWIRVSSTIWDLHLQGSDDTLNVATHLFTPAAMLLGGLEKLTKDSGDKDSSLRIWSPDLQRLMHKSFVVPARASFLNGRDLSSLTTALEVSSGVIDVSASVLYFLAAGASSSMTRRDLHRSNAEWMEQVFQLVEKAIRKRPDRNALILGILRQAVERSMPVGIEDLRFVAREYGLQEDRTDWDVLAAAGKCDPAIFYASADGNQLLDDICARSVSKGSHDAEYESVSDVAYGIMKAFRTGRDFTGFLKLWFEQMKRASKKDSTSTLVWLNVGRRYPKGEGLDEQMEKELLPQQLLELVQWAGDQEADAQTTTIFADVVARGIKSEAFEDVVGHKLFDLVTRAEVSTSTQPLRWGVIAKTLSWVEPAVRSSLWDTIKGQLGKVLEKSPVESEETFEAFKCCSEVWITMSPDGPHFDEAGAMLQSFTARLSAAMDAEGLKRLKLASLELNPDQNFSKDTVYQAYLSCHLRSLSRLNRLHSEREGGLPTPVQMIVGNAKVDATGLTTIWDSLLENEVNINDPKLSKQLINSLTDNLGDLGKRFLNDHGQMYIGSLIRLPSDAFTRQQRERIMTVLDQSRASMAKSKKKISAQGWKLFLSLATKMMSRPTFHEGMRFDDLQDIAESLSSFLLLDAPSSEESLELIERFSALASATLRQMTEHVEDRSLKYLTGSAELASSCDTRLSQADDAAKFPPLFTTLLKAVSVEMAHPNCQSHPELSKVLQTVERALEKTVSFFIKHAVMDKKLFDKPSAASELALFTVADVSSSAPQFVNVTDYKSSTVRKLEKRSREAMQSGDAKGWKMHIFMRMHLSAELENARPTAVDSLTSLPLELRETLLNQYMSSITRGMDRPAKMQFLRELATGFRNNDTDGQIRAIQHVVNQLMESPDITAKGGENGFAELHSDLLSALLASPTSPTFARTSQVLYTLLEKRPQAMGQWNIEATLSGVSGLSLKDNGGEQKASFSWLCKLVEVIIKKHRLRLEGHFHLLMTTLQALLHSFITHRCDVAAGNKAYLESMAHQYGRLITLVCEPTAGAVSRSQQHSSLDSATDAAKRSAGRHMYLVLMHYVKLQLECSVPVEVATALEPAMNSIFDITPQEGRKILNDAMDASGRAILREMFQRYTKFGKWSGV
ncbi:Urb2/Npa2 family-domain-containing protein [Stachybotrys elegans]|uniref:Urb2/Npa2 family-domain-containing protein n=1 Tax=Stachybotrys elegans TaxID=80388 RepID=A0A8K0WWV9_9HYPO|nr:Urb2/Npa2 family-domain-containing protein [Stachybotrys elegans]